MKKLIFVIAVIFLCNSNLSQTKTTVKPKTTTTKKTRNLQKEDWLK